MQENLNQWNFVVGAYVIGFGATLALVLTSWLSMRNAEARRDRSRGK